MEGLNVHWQLLLCVMPEFQCEANTEQDTSLKGLHQRFAQLIEMPSFLVLK
jgi:hypothetical protein